MGAFPRQESFRTGELTHSLHGSFALEAYKSGVRKALNFFVTKYGKLLSRPGTKLIGATKLTTDEPRLRSFDFSDNQAYTLEFGEKYIRIRKEGVPVEAAVLVIGGSVNAGGGGGAYIKRSTDGGATWSSTIVIRSRF